MLEHAVLAANNEVHITGRRLADIRERMEIPPTVIICRIVFEVIPIIVRRILRLKRADRIVFALAIEINTVRAGMTEHAVDYNSYALRLCRVD